MPPDPIAEPTPTPAPEAAPLTENTPTITPTPAPSRPDPKVVSVKEFLSRGDRKTKAEFDAKEPKPGPEKPADPAAKPSGETKPAPSAKKPEANPEVGPDQVRKPHPEKPAKPRLIRIGNESKTEEEWTTHYSDLKKAADTAAKPTEPAPPKTDAPAAQRTNEELDQEFIDQYGNELGITDEEWDQALATGNPSVIRNKMAKVALDTRQWAAQHLTGLKREIEAMKPAIEMADRVKQFEAEQTFNTANPDIAAHPDAAKTKTEVRSDLKRYAAFYEFNRTNGNSTPEETRFLDAYAQDPDALVTFNIRQRLKLDGKAEAPAAPAPAPVPQPPATRQGPPPPAGHRPGGAAPAQPVSAQRATIDRLQKAGF